MKKELSIFAQIAETIKDRILDGGYLPDERIPSVREIAIEREVNPNTVMKAYELLQREGLIYNKRGMGYFVEKKAFETILEQRKQTLKEETIPELLKDIQLLGMSPKELIDLLEQKIE